MDPKDLYFTLLESWNHRDAKAYAKLFSPHGNIVGFDGSTANGAREIETHLAPIFADHPTARYVGKVRDVRQLGNECVLLRAVAGMIPPGKMDIMPERNAIQTLVASRRGAEWQIELFQNTPARLDGRPEESKKLTDELEAEVPATA